MTIERRRILLVPPSNDPLMRDLWNNEGCTLFWFAANKPHKAQGGDASESPVSQAGFLLCKSYNQSLERIS